MKTRTLSRAATTLTVGMVVLLATTIFAQQLTKQRSSDQKTTLMVSDMVTRYHISQRKIDDDVSQRLIRRFLQEIDPQKLYLTQPEVDRLNRYSTQLDDLIKVGNVDFAYLAYDLYLKNAKLQLSRVHDLIDAPHDFTLDEELVIDAENRPWAKDEAELKERWRKRIKYDLLTLRLDGTDIDEARERLHKRYTNVAHTLEQTEDSEKLESYLSALTHCFDPHSSYMSPETLEDFQISMRLRLEGIGAALRSEEGYTTVASIVPGGAAAADGRLKVGDKIIGVAQDEEDYVDIVEMKLSKVVRYIRGPKGTKVRLQVKKADTGKVEEIVLTRQEIELKSSEVKGEIIQSGDRLKGTAVRVGVVHIPSFYRDFDGARNGDPDFKSTSRDVRKVLEDFQRQGGVDVVVVDLRTNGGGALSEAIEVSGLFIDQGPVVQVKQQNGTIKSHDDEDAGVAWDGPLVVLCNRLSASASEIFAGVIKDYQRGLIVGDTTTHGKGTVQNVMMVGRQFLQFLRQEQRGALKLTINQFYRVNGDSTQNRGVRSDVVLPSLFDHMELGESSLDNALPFDQIEAAPFRPLGMVSADIVSALQQASNRRVAADPEFQKLAEQITRYVARRDRSTVSLNEEKLRAEREQEKKDQGEEKDKDAEEETDPPVFPEGHYNDEILHITLDYLTALRGQKTAAN